MVEKAKRFREPFAWFLVACAVVQLLVSLGRWYYLHDRNEFGWADAARTLSGSPTTLTLVIALTLAVLVCSLWLPATEKVRGLGGAAVTVLGLSSVVSLAMLLVGLKSHTSTIVLRVLDLVGGLVDLAIKLACIVAIWRFSRTAAQSADVVAPELPRVPEPSPLQPASWTADQAVGAAWSRAGDAASGARADAIGATARGWEPASRSSALPELPAAPQRRDVPWATAGQQAAGESGVSSWEAEADPTHTTAPVPRQWRPLGTEDPTS
ncbi:MAG TPA: hypothetical protein H9987_03205 [Candidatus Luteococcus avicola]|nr:hypothetical protein [Candidatus Luteococcus avicola]